MQICEILMISFFLTNSICLGIYKYSKKSNINAFKNFFKVFISISLIIFSTGVMYLFFWGIETFIVLHKENYLIVKNYIEPIYSGGLLLIVLIIITSIIIRHLLKTKIYIRMEDSVFVDNLIFIGIFMVTILGVITIRDTTSRILMLTTLLGKFGWFDFNFEKLKESLISLLKTIKNMYVLISIVIITIIFFFLKNYEMNFSLAVFGASFGCLFSVFPLFKDL